MPGAGGGGSSSSSLARGPCAPARGGPAFSSSFLPSLAGRAWRVSGSHGPPAALLEPPQEVRPRLAVLPRVLKPPRPDPQVWAEHVPAVLPPVRQGHRLHEVGLNAGLQRWLEEPEESCRILNERLLPDMVYIKRDLCT